MLDRSRHISRSIELQFLFKVSAHELDFTSSSLSRQKTFFSLTLNTSLSLKTFYPCAFWPILIKTLGKCSNLLSFHAFMDFRPRFLGFFKIFRVFEFFLKFLGWDL